MKRLILALILMSCSTASAPDPTTQSRAGAAPAPDPVTITPSQQCCDDLLKQQDAPSVLTRLNACCTNHHEQILRSLCKLRSDLDGCAVTPPPAGAGGSLGTGGARTTGGAPATGGKPGTGGAKATGGSVGSGGATVATKCDTMCYNLVKLGCPDGKDFGTCISICAIHTSDDRFTQNIDCRINAKTIADAQKCGPASCR